MNSPKFSTNWKRSIQARKQRKYTYNAPLHVRQKLMHVHLSSELREKYGFRNILLKKGDKVKVLRGQFAKKEGVVERVDLKKGAVYVVGIELIKKDGTKLLSPLKNSNLMIISLDLNDKLRKAKLESKNNLNEKIVKKEIVTKKDSKESVSKVKNIK